MSTFLAECADHMFTCKNTKCIPMSLLCDGFDQCGDMSDETLPCGRHTIWKFTYDLFSVMVDFKIQTLLKCMNDI